MSDQNVIPATLLPQIKDALIELGYAHADTPLIFIQDYYFKYVMVKHTGHDVNIPYSESYLPQTIRDILGGGVLPASLGIAYDPLQPMTTFAQPRIRAFRTVPVDLKVSIEYTPTPERRLILVANTYNYGGDRPLYNGLTYSGLETALASRNRIPFEVTPDMKPNADGSYTLAPEMVNKILKVFAGVAAGNNDYSLDFYEFGSDGKATNVRVIDMTALLSLKYNKQFQATYQKLANDITAITLAVPDQIGSNADIMMRYDGITYAMTYNAVKGVYESFINKEFSTTFLNFTFNAPSTGQEFVLLSHNGEGLTKLADEPKPVEPEPEPQPSTPINNETRVASAGASIMNWPADGIDYSVWLMPGVYTAQAVVAVALGELSRIYVNKDWHNSAVVGLTFNSDGTTIDWTNPGDLIIRDQFPVALIAANNLSIQSPTRTAEIAEQPLDTQQVMFEFYPRRINNKLMVRLRVYPTDGENVTDWTPLHSYDYEMATPEGAVRDRAHVIIDTRSKEDAPSNYTTIHVDKV